MCTWARSGQLSTKDASIKRASRNGGFTWRTLTTRASRRSVAKVGVLTSVLFDRSDDHPLQAREAGDAVQQRCDGRDPYCGPTKTKVERDLGEILVLVRAKIANEVPPQWLDREKEERDPTDRRMGQGHRVSIAD